jgi:predicted anti-sigma-YlaC factor YlaD
MSSDPAPSPLPPAAAPPAAQGEAAPWPIAPAAPRRRHLTTGWRWVLACGWGTVMAGFGVMANTGFLLGNPPFWIDVPVVPFVLPVAVLVALAVDWRWALALSFVAVVGSFTVAGVDVADAYSIGLGELAFAVVALLVTVAATAGRVPTQDASRSTKSAALRTP